MATHTAKVKYDLHPFMAWSFEVRGYRNLIKNSTPNRSDCRSAGRWSGFIRQSFRFAHGCLFQLLQLQDKYFLHLHEWGSTKGGGLP